MTQVMKYRKLCKRLGYLCHVQIESGLAAITIFNKDVELAMFITPVTEQEEKQLRIAA